MNNRKKRAGARTLAGIGVLTAVAVVLQYLEFPIPLVPSFLKLDFSDLPELIGAFAYGPLAGIAIALLKNVIHLLVSQSEIVGELSNFLLGGVFALTAGLIYRRHKTKKTALLAGAAASLVMALVSVATNYFVVYPLYYKVLASEPVVLGFYQAILPSIQNVFQALWVFNVPFTLVKGLICVAIAMPVYKPLTPFLKGRRDASK